MDTYTNFGAKRRDRPSPETSVQRPGNWPTYGKGAREKTRPRQVVNEFGLIGCKSPTARILSLISVLMENYLSMICIISLEKKSHKFHRIATYSPNNLKSSTTCEFIALCKIFQKSVLKIFFDCFHNYFIQS